MDGAAGPGGCRVAVWSEVLPGRSFGGLTASRSGGLRRSGGEVVSAGAWGRAAAGPGDSGSRSLYARRRRACVGAARCLRRVLGLDCCSRGSLRLSYRGPAARLVERFAGRIGCLPFRRLALIWLGACAGRRRGLVQPSAHVIQTFLVSIARFLQAVEPHGRNIVRVLTDAIGHAEKSEAFVEAAQRVVDGLRAGLGKREARDQDDRCCFTDALSVRRPCGRASPGRPGTAPVREPSPRG